MSMNYNLVFKKEIVNGADRQVLMKIIPIALDNIDTSWTLVSGAHGVEVAMQGVQHSVACDSDDKPLPTIPPDNIVPVAVEGPVLGNTETASSTAAEKKKTNEEIPTEYTSTIPGTACLIRKGSLILIAYRRGKNKDKNTPNRICVSDTVKQEFFNHCKEVHGAQYSFTDKELAYDYWNKFMDTEYIRQYHIAASVKN